MACVFGNKVKTIYDLPENILLEIFLYLPRKDLCRANCVNKAWRRISNDNSLWRYVDMTPYKMDLPKMWKVVRAHLSDVLHTLKLGGYMFPESKHWSKNNVSDAMLKELTKRCPHLKHLTFVNMALNNVSSLSLPSTLVALEVESSTFLLEWLKPAVEAKSLQNLKHLSFKNSTILSNQALKGISMYSEIESLNISGCYRIKESGLKEIVSSLTCLKRLNIVGTESSDLILHLISRNLKDLEFLYISLKPHAESEIRSMCDQLPKLKEVWVDKELKYTFDR